MVLCGISLFKHIHYQTKRKKQKAKETKEKKKEMKKRTSGMRQFVQRHYMPSKTTDKKKKKKKKPNTTACGREKKKKKRREYEEPICIETHQSPSTPDPHWWVLFTTKIPRMAQSQILPGHYHFFLFFFFFSFNKKYVSSIFIHFPERKSGKS